MWNNSSVGNDRVVIEEFILHRARFCVSGTMFRKVHENMNGFVEPVEIRDRKLHLF